MVAGLVAASAWQPGVLARLGDKRRIYSAHPTVKRVESSDPGRPFSGKTSAM